MRERTNERTRRPRERPFGTDPRDVRFQFQRAQGRDGREGSGGGCAWEGKGWARAKKSTVPRRPSSWRIARACPNDRPTNQAGLGRSPRARPPSSRHLPRADAFVSSPSGRGRPGERDDASLSLSFIHIHHHHTAIAIPHHRVHHGIRHGITRQMGRNERETLFLFPFYPREGTPDG